MKILIHRGANQIGGSCIEIVTAESRIIFDIGEELPQIGEKAVEKKETLQVDDLFKDSIKTFKKVDGIFISHIHGDHIGLISKVQEDIPIYMGRYGYQIWSVIQDFTGNESVGNPIRFILNENPIVIKDVRITPFLIDHSAFDAFAFLIEYAGHKVFYTGDFRAHGFAWKYTQAIKRNPILKDIDQLIIEGTNLYKDSYVAETEEEITKKALIVMNEVEGNIFVLQSSANIARLQAIYQAALQSGRTLLVDIFTANILHKLPKQIPSPFTRSDIKIFYPYALTKRLIQKKPFLFNPFASYKISKEELRIRKDFVILIRGSMNYEVLNRFDMNDSHLLYSKWEGYQSEAGMKEFLKHFDTRITYLHTSGHADIPSLKEFVDCLNPKGIIPIHTETPEKYQKLFKGRRINQYREIVL